MSWSILRMGTNWQALAQTFDVEPHMPVEVQKAIKGIVEMCGVAHGVLVETDGHWDGRGYGIIKLTVRALRPEQIAWDGSPAPPVEVPQEALK